MPLKCIPLQHGPRRKAASLFLQGIFPEPINPIPAWLAGQSAAVQAELNNLLSYSPEPEFVLTLAELLPWVPGGLVDLYYDIFYFCRPVFRLAVEQLHRPDDLSDFLRLAERASVDASEVEAFKAQCPTPARMGQQARSGLSQQVSAGKGKMAGIMALFSQQQAVN